MDLRQQIARLQALLIDYAENPNYSAGPLLNVSSLLRREAARQLEFSGGRTAALCNALDDALVAAIEINIQLAAARED